MTIAEIGGREQALRLVLSALSNYSAPTMDEIRKISIEVLLMLQRLNQALDVESEELIKYVESKCNIFVPSSSVLSDPRDHEEWLAVRKASIQWHFWERYQQYLQDIVGLAPASIRNVNDVTDQILKLLENPLRPGEWDRRGLVVGQVQSGKTANYTGLICKAVDAGYKLIVVLAGVHNSLRAQTQLRLDESFLGFDTQKRMLFGEDNVRTGVGLLPGHAKLYTVNSLTNSSETGDFNLRAARNAGVMIGGDPVLLVVKKYKSVLNNVIKHMTLIQRSSDGQAGRPRVPEVPLLVIDDEADAASVNTKTVLDEFGQIDPELDPTVINGLIRRLLFDFEKSVYVGYTATPFANIFIHNQGYSNDFGEDLFPRSFIINLSPPSDYVGPTRVFGLEADLVAGVEESPGLPVVRRIDDYHGWMPDDHKKDWVPSPLPESLRRAIRTFILACAARIVRGQDHIHNSMLIHVTRFTAVQARVDDQVQEELQFLQQRLKRGDGKSPHTVLAELRKLWEEDFVPTSQTIGTPDSVPVEWSDLKEVLYAAASRIEIRRINGTAKDALVYAESPQGLSVIAIGGNKLSRGLTLEGLSVSYYLRASRMYDTLMQMGRWFGYRPGYLDLCRLYTSTELVKWYRDIAAADQELRATFDDMVAQDATPEDYGLGVRNHPDGLLITARAKMRTGTIVRLSFSQTIIETITFDEDAALNHQNLEATERLLVSAAGERARPQPGERKAYRGYQILRGVPADAVIEFLADYVTYDGAWRARSDILQKYIQGRAQDDELIDWTIALISNFTSESRASISGYEVGLTGRERHMQHADKAGSYSIRRLVSPRDEWLDLSPDELAYAVEESQRAWHTNRGNSKRTEPPTEPSGPVVRRIRPSQRGLLLLYPLAPQFPTPAVPVPDPIIGFAFSFPKSGRIAESAVEYTVNNVYWQQEFGVTQ